jgi:hypothetical protein
LKKCIPDLQAQNSLLCVHTFETVAEERKVDIGEVVKGKVERFVLVLGPVVKQERGLGDQQDASHENQACIVNNRQLIFW